MNDWHFGLIVGMDYEPQLRLLILAPATESEKWRRIGREHPWSALVLADTEGAWPIGLVVTASPDASGVVVLDDIATEEVGPA